MLELDEPLMESGPESSERCLFAFGIWLPPAPLSLGAYVTARSAGKLLFLSGMLPIANGIPASVGRLGTHLSVSDGRLAARLTTLNVLAVAVEYLGSLDRIEGVIKVSVILVTRADFVSHAAVADGASDLLKQIFVGSGHVRVVYGVQSLPRGVSLLLAVFTIC
jgi:enamine deaminase RidA (YjgF/YER057c/UK114 family)